MRYGHYDVQHPRLLKTEKVSFVVGLITVLGIIFGLNYAVMAILQPHTTQKIISPVPDTTPTPTITPTATPTPTTAPKTGKVEGIASYYSLAGCVGCRKDRKMANGEVLDDTKITAAYNRAPLNSYVTVTHKATTIKVKVTDRGGFERLGRVIDLSVAAKTALGCNDLCHVKVERGGEN